MAISENDSTPSNSPVVATPTAPSTDGITTDTISNDNINKSSTDIPTDVPKIASPDTERSTSPVSASDSDNNALRRPTKRRKPAELAAHERWVCPHIGCTKVYRKTSTNSIKAHIEACLHKSTAMAAALLGNSQRTMYPYAPYGQPGTATPNGYPYAYPHYAAPVHIQQQYYQHMQQALAPQTLNSTKPQPAFTAPALSLTHRNQWMLPTMTTAQLQSTTTQATTVPYTPTTPTGQQQQFYTQSQYMSTTLPFKSAMPAVVQRANSIPQQPVLVQQTSAQSVHSNTSSQKK